jgi:hypothetical protein
VKGRPRGRAGFKAHHVDRANERVWAVLENSNGFQAQYPRRSGCGGPSRALHTRCNYGDRLPQRAQQAARADPSLRTRHTVQRRTEICKFQLTRAATQLRTCHGQASPGGHAAGACMQAAVAHGQWWAMRCRAQPGASHMVQDISHSAFSSAELGRGLDPRPSQANAAGFPFCREVPLRLLSHHAVQHA